MHEVTVFQEQESLKDRTDLFWKIISFSDACFGIFTEILNPILEYRLEMDTLKVVN